MVGAVTEQDTELRTQRNQPGTWKNSFLSHKAQGPLKNKSVEGVIH